MRFFPALLFGISASLDALIVGITYGLRRIRIRLWQNFLISVITLLGTCLSVWLGAVLSPFLPALIAEAAAGTVLILLGAWYLIKSMRHCLQKCRKDKNLSVSEMPPGLSLGEALSLGFALSLNNMGIGLSASIAGLLLLPAAIVTFLCSVSFLLFGNLLGRCRIFKQAGVAADFLSGLLLIGLGVWGIFL